jgi:hypothetical protein
MRFPEKLPSLFTFHGLHRNPHVRTARRIFDLKERNPMVQDVAYVSSIPIETREIIQRLVHIPYIQQAYANRSEAASRRST